MITEPTNITALQLVPLTAPALWQVEFRSPCDGAHHQLYINGSLSDVTDALTQRTFDVYAQEFAQELLVLAVPPEHRHTDLSVLPGGLVCRPSWICPLIFSSALHYADTDLLAVYHDSATGHMADSPVQREHAWPPTGLRWGFGEDAFGEGGFGLDAGRQPALAGTFGIGPFGFDRDGTRLDVPLTTSGTHTLAVRIETDEGPVSETTTTIFEAASPPPPAEGVTVTHYDDVAQTLTLTILRG
jgi:hypothetical protein